MKKRLIIICLCFLQAACAVQSMVAGDRGALLSYGDLASEITVAYRDTSTGHAPEPRDEPVGAP